MNPSSARMVQLRRDLEHSKQQQQGKSYLVVKDPVTRRYFRFTESQASILELLTEAPVDAATVAERASERFGGSISASTIESFFDSLESKFLIDSPDVRDKLSNIQHQKLAEKNVLYWKLASINPERIFAWLLPRTTWAFTPAFHVFALFTIACGVTISYLHWREITAAAPSFLNVYGLLLIWPVIFCVTTIHEFSHGLTCCHYGGKVHEVGFMLIYFQPAFFCDVSDSWMFPSRRNRVYVTLAGGYAQLVVWGLCTIIWRITAADTVINHLTMIVILFSGLQTLVNFNPLIKLDGYYMLSDYLEIPNLRSKAVRGVWQRISGKEPSPPFREQRAQVIYGIAAALFSSTLLLYVYTALYTWATSRYAFSGLVGFVMFSTFTLRRSAAESFAGVRALASRAAIKRWRNLGIAAAALIIAVVGRWELKVTADFKILANNEAIVRAKTAGIVGEVLVHEGSQVRKGELLARLQDFDKQNKASEIEGEIGERRSQLALLVAGPRPEEIKEKATRVQTREQELQNTRRNEEQRAKLEQTRRTKQTQLEGAEQELKRSQEGQRAGVIAQADVDKNQNIVNVRKSEIAEIDAEIRALDEASNREADVKSRELAEAQNALTLIKLGSRPEEVHRIEAEVAKLENQLKLLRQELDKVEIRAPIDGVVTTPFVDRMVNQHLDSGGEFLHLVETKRVRAEMQVPEKELADVQTTYPVTLRVYSYPSREFVGHVDFVAPIAQTVETNHMVVVRVELPNDDGALKPEMTGKAKIHCGDQRIIDLMTRRLRKWIKIDFWDILP